ncbi:ribosomal protein L1/ribosomal biogenesis protein [Myxozyma melibiosi]|uniref:Ribosomal protein L1/ribosomal biogenesis protein n=1 Tax=Myxozyma melibiosi TaxID=54550 RepID=A0ABR1FDV2_9ASCO
MSSKKVKTGKKSTSKAVAAAKPAPVEEETVSGISGATDYSLEQTKKALMALLKHMEKVAAEGEVAADEGDDALSGKKRKLNLLSDDPSDPAQSDKKAIYLVVSTKKFLSDRLVMKPKRITVPHPIYNSDTTSICLLTKDPQRLYKDIFLPSDIGDDDPVISGSLARIIGVSKLRSKFKTFEARRQLRDGYDLFLADDRIVAMLPPLLGKTFIGVKKMPIPIRFLGPTGKKNEETQKAVKQQLSKKKRAEISPEEEIEQEKKNISVKRVKAEFERTLKSAIVVLPAGALTTVKIGFSTFTAEQLAENVDAVVEELAKSVIKGGWDGIRSLHVKSTDSISLPIFLTKSLE